MRILIVEDEKKTANYLRKGLTENDFIVDLAEHGEEGRGLSLAEAYDLIILDVMLPKRDGWTIIAEIRGSGKQTPVIFLTARDAVQDRVKGLELGADDYLVKPFAFSELLARIHAILRRGPSRQPEKFHIADLEIDLLRHKVTRGRRPLDLTPKEFLSDKIHVLRIVLKERPDDWDALREEVEWETSARRFEKYYARIQDQGGHVLIETPGMDKIVGPALFPKPIDVHETPQKGIKRKGRDGKSLLLMGAWAETGHARSEKRLHQVALDISHEEAILSDYRRNMSIMLLAGTIFSIAMSIFVARKGIRPLDQITKAAQRITATQLHERIVPAPWPKELAALATAFDGMLTRLEDSFTRLSQFSSDLAHELRTPINNLMGEAEVALSKTRTAEQYRQVIESSLEEFGRLARMIEGLLFLARTERADTRIDKTLFDARQELETVREFYEAVAKEQGIEVSCEGNAWIDADATLFRRAINNLLSNALQYTPRGINSCKLPVIFCFELRAWMEKHIATWCTLPMANSARER